MPGKIELVWTELVLTLLQGDHRLPLARLEPWLKLLFLATAGLHLPWGPCRPL